LKILVVEDNQALRQLLELELNHYGYNVATASTGVEALKLFKVHKPELVILDIMLPQLDGFELLSSFRERSTNTGIIVLSVLNTKEKRLKAFELGADDYVTKPFDMEELLARIEALGRRLGPLSTAGQVKNLESIELHESSREVERENRRVRLTKLEYDIFQLLYNHAGNVVKKDDLVVHIWGVAKKVSDSIIPVYIKYLREKIEKLNMRIETVRGIGYVLKI